MGRKMFAQNFTPKAILRASFVLLCLCGNNFFVRKEARRGNWEISNFWGSRGCSMLYEKCLSVSLTGDLPLFAVLHFSTMQFWTFEHRWKNVKKGICLCIRQVQSSFFYVTWHAGQLCFYSNFLERIWVWFCILKKKKKCWGKIFEKLGVIFS